MNKKVFILNYYKREKRKMTNQLIITLFVLNIKNYRKLICTHY